MPGTERKTRPMYPQLLARAEEKLEATKGTCRAPAGEQCHCCDLELLETIGHSSGDCNTELKIKEHCLQLKLGRAGKGNEKGGKIIVP